MIKDIEISNLTKMYGKNHGVTDLSLSVEKGDIFGFLGPNGAGKSTTIRSVLGMIKYQTGTVKILGMDANKDQINILKQVGYMPSEAMFYPNMRVSEVIKFAANIRKIDCYNEAKRLCDILEVDTNKKIQELSLGNRKKVSIVCAMQHKPDLFIFDEPTSGLDPLMQEAFFDLILEYNKKGTTCFLSSHVLSEIKKYCKNVGIIKEGRLIRVDSVSNFTKSNIRKVKITGINKLPQIDGIKDLVTSQNKVEFVYKNDIKYLVKSLSELNIEDLIIEEPTLEEIFMHYYEKEDN